MMADSDIPPAVKSPQEAPTHVVNNDSHMHQVWRCISIDLAFVKSLYGIFMAAELILSLLGLISSAVPKNEGCAYLFSGTYSYYQFTSSSCFIVSTVWYVLYGLAITKKLGFVRWDICEMVWLSFYIFNYLIASSVIAANACMQDGYKAAAAFGFICLFVLIGNLAFDVRTFIHKRKSSSITTAGTGASEASEEAKY